MRTEAETRARTDQHAVGVVLSQMRDHMHTATRGAAFFRGRNDGALETTVAAYWELLAYAVEGGLLEQLMDEANRDGEPTIHDVMTAEELAEADREADAYADAMSEAQWAGGEGAPF